MLLVVAASILGVSASADAQVKARFRRIGLFEGSLPFVRSGCMSFVEVDLANFGREVFEGELRVNQQDRDGDVVTSASEVGLTPDGAWHPKQVYFMSTVGATETTVRIRLYDKSGALVRMTADTGEEVTELLSPPYYDLPTADEFLIVDLTTPRKLPQLQCLDTTSALVGDSAHARRIRALSPSELPQEWQGLEAVDAIVWDDADPSELSARQIEMLFEWVRHGGRLLITGGSRNWQALAASQMAQHLPVSIKGLSTVREVQEFTRDIVRNEAMSRTLSRKYAKVGIGRCDMTGRSGAISIPADTRGLSPIAYRMLLGRGTLTFVGASLRDLLPAPARVARSLAAEGPISDAAKEELDEFRQTCDRIIAMNFLALPKPVVTQTHFLMGRSNLFDIAASTIGYKGLGFAFLMFALFFAVVYLLTASGSYFYLRRRDWQQHSWSAFAVISLAGTLIGVVMVWSLRGITTKVRQTTIVDAKAGEDTAHAYCLFGVKTPDHTRLDLRLPSSYAVDDPRYRSGVIRALPASTASESGISTFVAADNYRSSRGGTFLEDVPVRATLKEFTGRWSGSIDGTLDARLVVGAEERDRFGRGSFIHNNTGTRLENCFVLEGAQEIAGEGGMILTRCLSLGTLEKSGPESMIEGDALNRRLYFLPPNPRAPDEPLKPISGDQLQIDRHIRSWRSQLGQPLSASSQGGPIAVQAGSLSVDQEYFSLLLLSVFDLIQTDGNERLELSRSHGRMLDCSHAITRSTAVLIGYSRDPPPALLEINGVRRKPERSITIYRFVIPVERPERGPAD